MRDRAKTAKLIIFDLGGTVFSKGKQSFIDLLAERLKVNKEEVVHTIDGPHALQYRRNKISADIYWKIVRQELRIPAEFEDLERLWFDQYVPISDMPELLTELRQRYKVAYLSNNTPERAAYLQKKYDFLSWFDGGLFSYEAGVVKTDGGLYEMLLKKFEGILPSQTFIIDDRLQNLQEPEKKGFNTLVFENPIQIRNEFKKRGMLSTM